MSMINCQLDIVYLFLLSIIRNIILGLQPVILFCLLNPKASPWAGICSPFRLFF